MRITLTYLLNRDGLFSRTDHTGCNQATGYQYDTSSIIDIDSNINEQTGESSSLMVLSVHSEQSEPNNTEGNRLVISGSQNCLPGTTCENLDGQESIAHAVGDQVQCLQIESVGLQSSFSATAERRDDAGQNFDEVATQDPDNELIQQSLQIANSERSNNREFRVVHNGQSEPGDITNGENNSSDHNNYMEGNIDTEVNWNESGALEEQAGEVVENEGSDWHQSNNEWRNISNQSVDDNQLSNTENEWPENSLANEVGENPHLQEASEVWQEDGGFQEAVENWLGGPSDHESAPGGRVHGFYFPDDDNVYSVELRELHSRYVKPRDEFLHLPF